MGKDLKLTDDAKAVVGDVVAAVARAAATPHASTGSVKAAAVDALAPHLAKRPLLRLAFLTALSAVTKLLVKKLR